MDVMSRYKKTEVGLLPDDWDVVELSTVAATSSGTTPSRAMQDRYYRNGTIPWVKTLDLNNSAILVTDERVTERALKETSLQRYPAGSVLVAMYGGFKQIGRTGLLCTEATVNQAVTAVRPDPRRLESRYLLNVLNFHIDYWKSVASSSRKDPNITGKDIQNFPIALPPRKEQEAIADALHHADSFVKALEHLLEKKRAMKRGAMQNLLTGKRRLPSFNKTLAFKDTDMGRIAEDWNVVPLGRMLQTPPSYGINAPSVPFDSSLATYLRITDITDDGRFRDSTKVSVDNVLSSDYVLHDGDLVFARTGASVGKSYLYDSRDGELVFAGFLIRISPSAGQILPKYLAQFARTQAYWNWVKQNSMRSGQPGINGQQYASLPVPLPPSEREQRAIATILTDMDAELIEIESEHRKARAIKKGMMQELLTGKVRLL